MCKIGITSMELRVEILNVFVQALQDYILIKYQFY